MRLYFGTFDEKEANEITEQLRKAGIRTELRHSIDIDMRGYYYLEGKLDELKEKYKDEAKEAIEEFEKYFEKAKEVLRDGIDVKQFEEKFLDLVMPEREKYKEMKERIKEIERNKIYDELVKEFGIEKVEEFIYQLIEEMEFMNFFHSLLEKNGIKYENDKMYGEIPLNPYVKIYFDISKREAEKIGLKYEFDALIDKKVDLYVNLIDIIYETSRLEKLVNEKPGFIPLLFASDVVAMIVDKIKGKIDLDELLEKVRYFKKNGDEIRLTKDAINEILKTLEKAEIIKIKKGKVMLKEEKKRR